MKLLKESVFAFTPLNHRRSTAMLLTKSKQAGEQSKASRCRRRFKLFSSSKMTYVRMESEERRKKTAKEAEAKKDKENCHPAVNKEEKTKKRSWKRFRAAALTTCRYIGMGMAHMSPATAYSSPNYHVDPKTWNRSFNNSYNKSRGPQPQTPHWSSNMMYAGW